MKPARLPKLVGLVASAPGAGKDTFFKHLASTGAPVANIKFAAKLEQEVYGEFMRLRPQDIHWIRHSPTAKDNPFYFLSVNELAPGGYRSWLREELGFKGLGDPRSIRWHLIQYGTNYVRKHLGKDSYWLDSGMEAARLAHTYRQTAVITDVRFPNEAEAIRKAGGILVFIDSPWNSNGNGGIADGLIAKEDCHLVVSNIYGKPEAAAEQFLHFIEKGPYND